VAILLDTGVLYAYYDRRDKYQALRLGFVDAAVLAMAEHLKLGRIATTDRRHFNSVRLSVPLELLPEV
jgi:predicted nucleic acid-binding protein